MHVDDRGPPVRRHHARAHGVPLFRATVSPFMKTPSRALPSTVKAGGHYTNSIRALADAHARGFDESILLNDRGEIAEGSGENVFIVRDGVLITNDADADILLGITRASVIAIAREAGITTRVRPITIDDLAQSDEAFFTGTAAEVVPIVRIDARELGAEGPLTERLRTVYTEIVRGAGRPRSLADAGVLRSMRRYGRRMFGARASVALALACALVPDRSAARRGRRARSARLQGVRRLERDPHAASSPTTAGISRTR